MAFDMSRCPQTEPEALEWFYNGIGRVLGSDATGWESVMANCGLPPGYGPGVVPNAMMPFFAFTQQFSGGPKGRIFLPTSRPDENGYYTRCIQYLDDAVGTYSKQAAKAKGKGAPAPDLKSAGLVWAWYWIAGNEYDPVQDETGSGPSPVPPTTTGISAEEVQAMIDASLNPIYAMMEGALKIGDKIALRTNSGLIAGIAGGGPTSEDAPIEWIGKNHIHAWESFEVEKGE